MAPVSLASVAPVVRQCEQVANVRPALPALEQAAIGLFKQCELDGWRTTLGPIVPWDAPQFTEAAMAYIDDRFRRQYSGRELFLRQQAAALLKRGYSLAYVSKQTALSVESLDDLRTELHMASVTKFQGGAGC